MPHNPERARSGDRLALHHAILGTVAVMEEAAPSGRVTGYGVTTPAGLEQESLAVGRESCSPWPPELAAGQRTWPPSGCRCTG
ncbi:hypothetical protein ABTX83_00690 [Streptomyces werraensis]|uniref:hypothetical protein n=1 Tax=Streptomyces werraensis TaxID=68284 RepID=UPI0033334936